MKSISLNREKVNLLSYVFATFATEGITSYQLFPIFWKAISILELTCKLKLIVATYGSASQTRAFFKMHEALEETIQLLIAHHICMH